MTSENTPTKPDNDPEDEKPEIAPGEDPKVTDQWERHEQSGENMQAHLISRQQGAAVPENPKAAAFTEDDRVLNEKRNRELSVQMADHLRSRIKEKYAAQLAAQGINVDDLETFPDMPSLVQLADQLKKG